MAQKERNRDVEEVKSAANSQLLDKDTLLCLICFAEKPNYGFMTFSSCGHTFCMECISEAFRYKVIEGQVKLQCLQCSVEVTQEELELVCDEGLNQKYLDACLNRYLSTTPNVRYCPAPDCQFACIDTSTSAHSTVVEQHFVCHSEECRKEFCNKCKQPWHEGKTCQEVREQMPPEIRQITEDMERIEVEIKKNTKECPRCHNKIEKMNETCNMVVCWYCDLKFCWLCGQEVNDWHFFSPTGCTMYGSRSWSRRRLYCCRFWMWATAPLLLLVLTLLVYPLSLVLVPVFLAFLAYYLTSKGKSGKCVKVCIVVTIVVTILLSILLDVILALLCTVAFYLLGLVYIYCCMPLALVLQYNSDTQTLIDLERGTA